MRSQLFSHPYLAAAVLLTAATEAVFYFGSRNAALAPAQYAVAAVATALVTWLCVWVVTWE